MRKTLLIGVILAAALFTMNSAYAGKVAKRSLPSTTARTVYIAERTGSIWVWNSSTWPNAVHQ